VGIILSSIVEEMKVFHNPFDLNVCSFGRCAHANYLGTNIKHVLLTKTSPSYNTYNDYFFYNIDKFFVKSLNYTTKDNPECNENIE
jgi:hypothetical protein